MHVEIRSMTNDSIQACVTSESAALDWLDHDSIQNGAFSHYARSTDTGQRFISAIAVETLLNLGLIDAADRSPAQFFSVLDRLKVATMGPDPEQRKQAFVLASRICETPDPQRSLSEMDFEPGDLALQFVDAIVHIRSQQPDSSRMSALCDEYVSHQNGWLPLSEHEACKDVVNAMAKTGTHRVNGLHSSVEDSERESQSYTKDAWR